MHETQIERIDYLENRLGIIRRMIIADSYCIEILKKLRQASNTLAKMENDIFENHLNGCVARSFSSDDPREREIKIEEIRDLLTRAR